MIASKLFVRSLTRGKSTAAAAVAYNNKNVPIRQTQLFINNEFVDAVSGDRLEVFHPATGEVICDVAEGDKADVDIAVAAARKAFEVGSPWRTMDASMRGRLIYKLADAIENDIEYIAALETLDNGKPYSDSLDVDVPLVINTLRYFAGWADKIHGKTIPSDGSNFVYTRHEPVGVVGGITPWNFPLAMFAWKVAPMLACGNTAVMKVAEQTPLTALYVAKLAKDVGFPAGVLNVISGHGHTAGQALGMHMDVDKIGFTGSTEVGKLIQQYSAQSNLKRVTLELGGKSPNIVFDDCNLDAAVDAAHMGVFFNVGQCCCAGTRLYVQESIYDHFVERMVEKAQHRVLGDPYDPSTNHGPQIDGEQLNKIIGLVNSGVEQGASLQTGGAQHGDKGFYMQPTVFADVKDHMNISTDEIFGPVMQISSFKDEDEVISRANNTPYGLAAAVFTNDINRMYKMTSSLKAGSVWGNTYNVLVPQSPFGGFKESGHGRDLGEYALNHYTEVKCVTLAVPQKCS